MTVRSMRRIQAGATLMEVLIAMSISLVVTASMIGLMANSLSSTARIITMTKLSDDLRVTMQMISRDLRRASYNANSISCYGNLDCVNSDLLADNVNFDGECFSFQWDRDYDKTPDDSGWGDSTDDAPGAFRRREIGGVGVIEMWTGTTDTETEPCDVDEQWVEITDRNNMNISGFSVAEVASYDQVIRDDGVNPIIKQKVRKIRVNLAGSLVMDPTITRQIEDIINVRNDLLFDEPQPGP
jgi:hypothetical protein